SLEKLLQSFDDLNYVFGDIIVSDDGSKPDHLNYINSLKEKFPIRIIGTEKNKGLGNNINKGQDQVKTLYTMYIQEDFEPLHTFYKSLKDAFYFMENDHQLDIVRFWSYYRYPYLRPFSKGFSEMYIKLFSSDYSKIYFYGDTPHIRRS